jgi:hypothetical protein
MAAVRAMVKACHHGPPRAEVSGIVQNPGEFRPSDEDFGETFRLLPNA